MRSVTSEPIWNMYRGKPNDRQLLREKASVVAKLIVSILDDGQDIASHVSKDKIGEHEILLARAETAAFLLRIFDEVTFWHLSSCERDLFMDALETDVIAQLQEIGVDSNEFVTLFQKRVVEYSIYKKWVAKENESSGRTLFWEFTKNVAAALGVGKSAIFNTMLSTLLLRQLDRWDLRTLLKG